MTREEAIKILQEHRVTFQSDFGWNTSVLEALDIAISALSENKGDLISRQAVLDIWHTSYSDIREENEEIQYKKIAFELPSVENKGEFDGMTNGEVIQEIYRFHSDMNCGSNGEYVHIWSNDGNCQMTIHKDFWNAPYQKGGEI